MPTPDKTPMHLSTNGPEDRPIVYPDEAPTQNAEIVARLRSLSNVMNALLNTQSDSRAHRTVLSIRKKLCQFHLESYHSEHEVLIEAYLRTHTKIEEGREIDNLLAWINKVSFNVIREYSRRSIKNSRLLKKNTKEIATLSGEATQPTFLNESSIRQLVSIMNGMSDRDRRILVLRVGMGLSWREVKAQLSHQTHPDDLPEATLRKQGERALRRLRQAFDS